MPTGYRPSTDIAATLADMQAHLNEITENPPTPADRDEAMGLFFQTEQLKEIIPELQWDLFEAQAAEHEAARRGCTPQEVVATWMDVDFTLPDYDDHTSDDPRCTQTIADEYGMHIETSPSPLEEMELNQ